METLDLREAIIDIISGHNPRTLILSVKAFLEFGRTCAKEDLIEDKEGAYFVLGRTKICCAASYGTLDLSKEDIYTWEI